MTGLSHWTCLLEDHKLPCFLADINTHKVVYLNNEMKKLLEHHETVLGRRFYEVIANDNATITNDFAFNWEVQNSFKYKIFNEALHQEFTVYSRKITVDGTDYNFTKYEPCSSGGEMSYEEALVHCMEILEKEEEAYRTVALLQILGDYYQSEKAMLYVVNRANMSITSMKYWKKHEGITVTEDLVEATNQETIKNWLQGRNEVGIVDASKTYSSYVSGSVEAQILDTFSLDNLVMSAIETPDQESMGMVVLANRSNFDSDFRLLQTITFFLEKELNQNTTPTDHLHDVDWLTGFQSRSAYSRKLEELQAQPPKQLAVIFTNINGLKAINTEFGLAKGDSYIKYASQILKNYFNVDFYRISGDEFIAFLEDMDKEDFEQKVFSLQGQLSETERDYFSVGHAWAEHRFKVENLIKEADTVMYINKQNYYHHAHRSFHDINDTTLSDLLSYLQNEEFMIYLQAQVKLEDNSLYGAEALIRRFDRTNQKMVFPDEFIPLYEKKSVIRHIDIFVVDQVCGLLAQWKKVGKMIPISVNLSRVTLQEYGIVKTIADICDRHGVPREYLVIEVTERVGLIENNVASSLIGEFTENGFKISLDDFGCAYSNIVTLAQIEVDEVKLDKSLVDYLTSNDKNYVLVKNVLTMCHELNGTSTLAEGIEEAEQAELLYQLGCHLGQGYYYSRPIPVAEFCEKYKMQ